MDVTEIIRETKDHLRLLRQLGVEEIQEMQTRDNGTGLEDLRQTIGDCRRCKLASGRTHIVFGSGNPESPLVFVGEAPGEEEDLQAKPFVGRAGHLLTRMIQAMGLRREDVYIANIIKCRPPGNRNPEADEIRSCEPFLLEQLGIIRPKVICALGKFAAQTLLKTEVSISRLRGTVCHLPVEPGSRFEQADRLTTHHGLEEIKVIPTFHPAYLLRNPSSKRVVWEDLQLIMKELQIPLPPDMTRQEGA
jgi:DNA polymerase